MRNLELAALFYKIADLLEMQGIKWKPQAYRRAAKSLEALERDIEELWKEGKLKEIPGVGEGIERHIDEFLRTGKVRPFEAVMRKIPKGLDELMEIESIGPKKAFFLYKKLKIKNLADLEAAVKRHKLENLQGFGEKSEQNILKGIGMYKRGHERMLLGKALSIAEGIVAELKKNRGIERIAIAGSLRRMKETIGDIDILATAKNANAVMDAFVNMQEVRDVLAKGTTKTTVVLNSGVQADVRVLKDSEFGSALQYFTGNKEHNIRLREIAIKRGLKLSEYGLFEKKTGKRIAGKTEEGIYAKFGMKYIEPELREDRGELQAAMQNKLPKIISYGSAKGDFHVHSSWSDGSEGIEEIANAAKNIGYEWMCLTDHSESERIAHGMDEERLLKQIAEIRKINKKIKPFRILAGSEVDIKANGELDFSNDVLKKLDVVVAAVHSGFKSTKEQMTSRVLNAISNKYVKIIAHPTGRLIGKREGYEIDLERIFEACAKNKVMPEINAYPERTDLNDSNAKRAIELGCKIAIGTDAHSIEQLHYMRLGIAMARRAWAKEKEGENTLGLREMEKLLRLRE